MPTPASLPTLVQLSELGSLNVSEAVRVVGSCFSHQDCKDDIRNVYTNYANGVKRMVSFGQDVELLRYEALTSGPRVVGAGGIYRVVGESSGICWLGWLGVDPLLQGQGLGSTLLKRLFSIAQNFDAQEIKVYTPAYLAEYAQCRAVYKHLGFVHRPEEDFIHPVTGDDVVEHMLVKPITKALPNDLSCFSFPASAQR